MANDSSMLNIDMVEQFGKNIANVSAQTLEISPDWGSSSKQ